MMIQPNDISAIPECLHGADIVSLAKGTRIFQAGDDCNQFFYLLNGSIRVDLVSKSGRSIMLYRFGANETCILTTSCLLSGDNYCAEAHVEEDIQACIVPFSIFESRLNESDDFRKLVFASFSHRLAAMMSKIEEVAFVPIDVRLASRVLQLHAETPIIYVTHEQLAADLGTAREVISRKFAQWDKQGLIQRGRGSLQILDLRKLQQMATLDD